MYKGRRGYANSKTAVVWDVKNDRWHWLTQMRWPSASLDLRRQMLIADCSSHILSSDGEVSDTCRNLNKRLIQAFQQEDPTICACYCKISSSFFSLPLSSSSSTASSSSSLLPQCSWASLTPNEAELMLADFSPNTIEKWTYSKQSLLQQTGVRSMHISRLLGGIPGSYQAIHKEETCKSWEGAYTRRDTAASIQYRKDSCKFIQEKKKFFSSWHWR